MQAVSTQNQAGGVSFAASHLSIAGDSEDIFLKPSINQPVGLHMTQCLFTSFGAYYSEIVPCRGCL